MANLLIGSVAERAGLSAPTIRYYESIGLGRRTIMALQKGGAISVQTPNCGCERNLNSPVAG